MTIKTALLTLCLGAGLAAADAAQEKLAKDYFVKGDRAYNLGKFDEAIENYSKAYETLPLPEFLFNIAQSHRLAGHCKEAVYFYKRFLSAKLDDKTPLSDKKRADIDKHIAECEAKIVPDPVPTPTETPKDPPVEAPKPAPKPVVAVVTKPDPTPIKVTARGERGDLVRVRAAAGVAKLGAGDLVIPLQPTVALGIGHPFGRFEVGLRGAYTPLPYGPSTDQQDATVFGGWATVAFAQPINRRLRVGAEVGAGLVHLGNLVDGNPLTTTRRADTFTLASARAGIAADVLVTSKLMLTVSPSLVFSPGIDGMSVSALREIGVLAGVGFRQ